MWKPIALVACCAVVASPIALADEGNPSSAVEATPCTPAKKVYARSHWREPHPARGENICDIAPRRIRKLKAAFHLYRHYRQIAPYRCHKGREGYYAIPCYIIECESHFNWWARNGSGASWIYQLLGWGAPAPTSFRNRVRNHEIAAGLSLSNWVCA